MSNVKQCGLNESTCGYSCMNCLVRQFSLLAGLHNEELVILEKHRGSKIFKAGETIFKEGEISKGLLCLHTGKVKITKSGLFESDAIIGLRKPVDFIGLDALILEKGYTNSAIALEDTTICYLEKTGFLAVVKKNPDLAMSLMRLLAQKSENANERMLILTQKHMRGRLADALLLLCKSYGTLADKQTLNIQLKRADLAAIANMTPANAIRVLSLFVKEKLIETDKRQIKIKDIEGLKKVSQLG